MYHQRPMCSSDIPQVAQLISQAWTINGPTSEMHVGDLYWALFHRRVSIAELESVLWCRKDESVAAFSMLSRSGWCDLVVDSGVDPKHIMPQVTELVEQTVAARGGRRVRITRRVESPEFETALINAGYQRMRFGYLTLEHDLQETNSTALPAGFEITNASESHVTAEAYGAAWRSAFPADERSNDDIESLRQAPGYEPNLDFACESPDGDVAAFCTVWYDSATKSGLFEPVGTAAEFQRRGLGKTLLNEALVRLKNTGAERAFVRVHSENKRAKSFYTSCGFRVASTAFGFERELA